MEKVLKRYLKQDDLPLARKRKIEAVLNLIHFRDEEYMCDLQNLGQKLIQFFQPHLQKMRLDRPKSVITLGRMTGYFRKHPVPHEVLDGLVEDPQFSLGVDRRVVASLVADYPDLRISRIGGIKLQWFLLLANYRPIRAITGPFVVHYSVQLMQF